MNEEKDVEIVPDQNGKSIVRINNIIFRGKQNIDWAAVELYLQKYVGQIIEVSDEVVEIDKKFTDEYAGSKYTKSLRGGIAKAKANAAQGIPEILKIGIAKKVMENKKEKHNHTAKYGWKYYSTRFAIPIYNENTKEVTYNSYSAIIVVRSAKNGKSYLYDIMKIKKEASKPSWT